MAISSIVIKQTRHQLRTQAMLEAGVNPKSWYQQPRSKVEANRKTKVKKGYAKHKAKALDY